MKTKLMVMKMLAIATTVWSAEIAIVIAVAVYATNATVSMNTKKASGVPLKPRIEAQHKHTLRDKNTTLHTHTHTHTRVHTHTHTHTHIHINHTGWLYSFVVCVLIGN